nr:helix-turn-helix domain-containing protein [Halomicroarcula nitratireducens]
MEFDTPDICPIVELSAAAETTINSVATNVCSSDRTECVTEFSMDADGDFEVDMTPIFSHRSSDRYRFTHDDGVDCPCECLGQFGCPVARYVARNGTLTIVFHAADYDQLQEVIGELHDQFPEINIKRLVQSPAGEQAEDSVFVDRGKLTHRQLEILETAYEKGYFDRPRRSNATEIAAELDINPSTFREHLTAAESKILEDLL